MARAPRVQTRRLVDALLGLALALAVLSPMIFGPALGPLAQALGASDTHLCACGMAPGKCGCPECARLEHQRLEESAPRPYPVLRGPCSRDRAMTGYGALPPAMPSGAAVLLRPVVERGMVPWVDAVPEGPLCEPATPPPRPVA